MAGSVPHAPDSPAARGEAIAAALEEAASNVFRRLEANARKRTDWQASIQQLMDERSGQQGGGDDGPADAAASASASAPLGRLAATPLDAAVRQVADQLRTHPAADAASAVAAAAMRIRGRSARAIARDFDRLFITTRRELLDHLADHPDGGDATAAAGAAGGRLDGVVDVATRVLSEERGGTTALDRLLRDFYPLLDDLDDPATRAAAVRIFAHLILILLIRLARDFVEELALLANPQWQGLPLHQGGAPRNPSQPAVAIATAVRGMIAAERLPPVADLLRLVNHHNVAASASPRPSAPLIGTLPRHQLIVFLEKRKKHTHAWWFDPSGAYRTGWLKSGYVDRLR